jgi:hypothetical protein
MIPFLAHLAMKSAAHASVCMGDNDLTCYLCRPEKPHHPINIRKNTMKGITRAIKKQGHMTEKVCRSLLALIYKKLAIPVAGITKIPRRKAAKPAHEPFPVFITITIKTNND